MERTVYQAPRESRAHSDHTAQLDHPETLAPLDLQDQLAKSGPKAHVEKREHKAHLASEAHLDHLDHGERLAHLVFPDLLVFLEPLVRLADQVAMEQLERQDQVGHPEMTVLGVCLARREGKVHVVTREIRETGVTRGHLVHLDKWVFQDHRDPKDPGETVVSLDEMATLAQTDLKDSRDHGERRETKECLETLDKRERVEHPDNQPQSTLDHNLRILLEL
jgi:hypothetical protein